MTVSVIISKLSGRQLGASPALSERCSTYGNLGLDFANTPHKIVPAEQQDNSVLLYDVSFQDPPAD
jgi:hypothetical protein